MVITPARTCGRRQLCVAELARSAVSGASITELTNLAVDALARETGVRPAAARHPLVSAAQSTADVDETLRPFLDSLTSVLALAQRMETVHALMDEVPDAIVRFDRDLRCVYVNSSGERLLQLNADQLLGLSVSAFGLSELQRGAYELALHLTLRTAHEQRLEIRIGEQNYSTRLVPELSIDQQVVAIVSIWRALP